jgi:hypothetical protein
MPSNHMAVLQLQYVRITMEIYKEITNDAYMNHGQRRSDWNNCLSPRHYARYAHLREKQKWTEFYSFEIVSSDIPSSEYQNIIVDSYGSARRCKKEEGRVWDNIFFWKSVKCVPVTGCRVRVKSSCGKSSIETEKSIIICM